ncbi:hypothetical protein E1293_06120 [Actinomadura darangshiensis]|uniref:Uncharacterized protein n=1 Tax=Actinomadura darangshiensis TaxID=705336 RepID=A0A4R5BT65_9ACTN|nr:hypothetical protein [Actinomadura darangshiensis]TDD88683.1 hypothetical protein E1293_06120 [Actinomadura darangshiensis]
MHVLGINAIFHDPAAALVPDGPARIHVPEPAADLALRALNAGHGLVLGDRQITHPVLPAGFWASVRAEAGNADDILMWRMHGPSWRNRAGEGRGLIRRHVLTTAAGLLALTAALRRRGTAAAVDLVLGGRRRP